MGRVRLETLKVAHEALSRGRRHVAGGEWCSLGGRRPATRGGARREEGGKGLDQLPSKPASEGGEGRGGKSGRGEMECESGRQNVVKIF